MHHFAGNDLKFYQEFVRGKYIGRSRQIQLMTLLLHFEFPSPPLQGIFLAHCTIYWLGYNSFQAFMLLTASDGKAQSNTIC